MAQNDFTKKNARVGAPAQAVLDAGLNVFALELLVESFTAVRGKDAERSSLRTAGLRFACR